MALIHLGYLRVIRDLLIMIRSVYMHAIIINSDFAIRVSSVYCGLDRGREDVWGGYVEGKDSCVLENETRFFGVKYGPYYEDSEKS